MRRHTLRLQAVRAILSQRFLAQSRPRCHPELALPKSAETDNTPLAQKKPLPFCFETGLSLYAKRSPRPFPPPFVSPPAGSFSDPLTTHHRNRAVVNGEIIRGSTNGDDAAYASQYFIGVNDGVGAWSTRPGGHAGLWSRLILHFWAMETEKDACRLRLPAQDYEPDPVEYLQKAYEQTLKATSEPNLWQGTTTAVGAHLHYQRSEPDAPPSPLLYVTNLGDSQLLVLRPRDSELLYKTKEQWHWFDCPRQLGTNSPDTPREIAVMDKVEIQEHDVVLAMSDGVIDNLWEHEIIENVIQSIRKWEQGQGGTSTGNREGGGGGGMKFVADQLVKAAMEIATDPFAESPFMEKAVEEGLPMEGGKLDDISVVAALCKRSKG